ncbi:MAG: SGNH/GDSL hydrolase family protein [Clostridia bacterium]|nr:SGNH/GDSL hydrolase family protein [Clostridia bacterium]
MKIMEKLAARNKNFFGNRPVTIACLGDSVTHGCFEIFINANGNIDTVCRADEAYPELLKRELANLFPFATPVIVNAGVSGDKSYGGLERLERDVLSFKPDLVIVDFGLNDSMNKDIEGGLKTYDKSMRAIFEKVLSSGAECILLTPNFMNKGVSPFLTEPLFIEIAKEAAVVQNEGILTRYVETAKKAAEDMGVPVADAYAVWQALSENGVDTDALLANNINHPNKKAHGFFVTEIMRRILE